MVKNKWVRLKIILAMFSLITIMCSCDDVDDIVNNKEQDSMEKEEQINANSKLEGDTETETVERIEQTEEQVYNATSQNLDQNNKSEDLEGTIQNEEIDSFEMEYDVRNTIYVCTRENYISYYNGETYLSSDINYYNSEGLLVKKVPYADNQPCDQWNEYEYDEKGNLIKEISYYSYGEYADVTEYQYDNTGLLIKKICSEGGETNLIQEYSYDDNGNLIHEYFLNTVGSFSKDLNIEYEYEFDVNNNMVSRKEFVDQELRIWEEYEYDSRGNAIGLNFRDEDGEIYTARTYDYIYDIDGNITKRTEYSDGIITNENEYDSMNHLIKEKIYINGELDLEIEYVWKSLEEALAEQ